MNQVMPRMYGYDFPEEVNWTVREGEQWCVIGPNGSGKTMLADLVAGKYAVKSGYALYPFWTEEYRKTSHKTYPTEAIRKVSFESAYMLSDYKNMYYQQRFHSFDNELTPTVEELIANVPDQEYVSWLCQRLHIEPLFPKHTVMLSSGELRRLLIVLALVQRPKLLIFDNPFIGLDAETRGELDEFFFELSHIQQLMFLVPAVNEIPKVTTHVMVADHNRYKVVGTLNQFLNSDGAARLDPQMSYSVGTLPKPFNNDDRKYDYVMRMKDICINYKDVPLYQHLNWDIKRGEKWALIGRNGSGKSTLLSLLAADNPKAYCLDITIFDRKRGTGESIWDIKRPIGYISSEMHLFFHEDQPCLKIVGSGLFDTIGLFRNCSEEQYAQALAWMKLLEIDHLKDRSFLKISGGEQRLVLLARTLVKNPELLILDEPLHGLDMHYKRLCRAVIEKYCAQKGTTMIYVTHRREEIPSCVDKFFELKKADRKA